MQKRKARSWMREYWRPLLALSYMIIILFDFVGAPILWSALQVYAEGEVSSQWNPLTLNGGGIFHGAMGAILGISAYSRGQEKLENLRNPYQDFGNQNFQNDFSLNSNTNTQQTDNMFLSDIYGNDNNRRL